VTDIAATYYDGLTSRGREVVLRLQGDAVCIAGDGVDCVLPFADVRLSPPLGNTRRLLFLPDGAQCEIADARGIEDWPIPSATGWLHRLERNLLYVGIALVVMVAAVWAGTIHGIPAAAKLAAYRLPFETTLALGEQSLHVLDQSLFSPTQLMPARQHELQGKFRMMRRVLPDRPDYRLEFRHSRALGANAFAFPSGVIVMTDDLIALAQHDDELVAVLAHEIGHLEYRHGLRTLLQNSAMALLVMAMTGDPSSLLALSATALVDAKYSREFETEADDFALAHTQQNHISPRRFADILSRMDANHAERNGVTGFLSTHPTTPERIQRFQHD
jgi:Zn-dependent protease with chaperone function